MKLIDYLPYYLGCDYWTNNSQGNLNAKTLPDVIDMCKREMGVQLHLRRLKDMTEEDWEAVTRETKLTHDTIARDSLKDSFIKGGFDDRYHWTVVNKAIIALRKRCIDVDNLIDAGLAVDVKTIQP